MSLVPLLFSDWWEDLDHPHSVLDQHFGLPINREELINRLAPSTSEILLYKPSRAQRRTSRYHPFLQSLLKKSSKGASTVSPDKDNFTVSLDVQQFSPEEINVKVVDNHLIVEGKHEEKEDEHGWISRQFVRKYLVPNQCDIDQVESRLSSDGVLTLIVPKKALPKPDSNEKIIKIQYTGEPAIAHHEAGENSPSKDQQNQQRQTPQRGKKPIVKAA
ncbi:hypothetical protein QAD02_015480 [Eretmocerus hayati]|uniref:Uncharacterized protein n=1 Tax=Eretmocerus hayati TaxID=131215 RepID=A0ACC2P9C9_9HYME|nr:hypothetical protein QAD02_015480 [Eretmocerus hayati]